MGNDVQFGNAALSRIVPAHRHTMEFNWVNRDFMVMSPKFREIRAKLRKPMDACKWCGHPIADGEMMALAQPKKPGSANVILCQGCAALATSNPKAGQE